MCAFYRWNRDDDERESAHNLLKDAMTQQFNSIYGTDADDINSWQNLCRVLRIFPIPDKLRACRNAVKSTHVNIVDLIDTINTGQRVRVFGSVQELSTYTKESAKYFPKQNAYAGGVLKFLLRDILNPHAVAVNRTSRVGTKRSRGRRDN